MAEEIKETVMNETIPAVEEKQKYDLVDMLNGFATAGKTYLSNQSRLDIGKDIMSVIGVGAIGYELSKSNRVKKFFGSIKTGVGNVWDKTIGGKFKKKKSEPAKDPQEKEEEE